ncbi:MAG TPA: alanine racemase, partial [Actinomycetota bacterium]|nr:alanine racemase [Actinomycetota bacterium]
VDRPALADEISRRAGGPIQVLAEVKLTGEEQKGGVQRADLPALVRHVLDLPNLELVGLMTMARKGSPELARPVFRELARLRSELAEEYSGRIHHLSMGMSQDYEVAVEEGATLVRVGEAVFGPRHPRQAHLGPDRIGESER